MHPISETLCNAYDELYRQGQVKFPLRDKQKHAIDSTVKTVEASYFGIEKYSTPQQKAVAYLCFLIKNHPVVDGNKRLAVLFFSVYCIVNKINPNLSEYSLDQMAVAIAISDLKMNVLMDAVSMVFFHVNMQGGTKFNHKG